MANDVYRQVDEYIIDLFAQEDDVLKQIQQRNDNLNVPQINISPSQGKLLQVLSQLVSAENILEIGTCAGYSTIWLAKAVSEKGKVVTLEVDEQLAAIAKENFKMTGVDDRIELRTGKAIDSLQVLKGEGGPKFDMVFIDADKPPYLEYFNLAVELCRSGAVIVADNVVREGKVLDKGSKDDAVMGVQRLNEAVATDSRVNTTIMQTVGVKEHDGMLIAVVK